MQDRIRPICGRNNYFRLREYRHVTSHPGVGDSRSRKLRRDDDVERQADGEGEDEDNVDDDEKESEK